MATIDLRPINDLTRTCSQPGQPTYHEYVHFLKLLGHVQDHKIDHPISNTPSTPQNSELQRRMPDRQDDNTDWRAEQALWNIDDLPDVLYIFKMPEYWLSEKDLKEPPQKQYQIYGKTLRDIPILPDHISSKLEGWRYHAWTIFDPRISYTDISDRIAPKHRPAEKSRIQMRVARFREKFRSHGWVTRGGKGLIEQRTIEKELVDAGLDPQQNSTRGISWGLVDKRLGEAGGRIDVPDAIKRKATCTVSLLDQDSTVLPSAIQHLPGLPITIPSVPAMSFTQPLPSLPNASSVVRAPAQVSPREVLIQRRQLIPISAARRGTRQTTQQAPPTSPSTPHSMEPPTTPTRPPRAAIRTPRPARTSLPLVQPPIQTAITIQYAGHILVLKTSAERQHPPEADVELLTRFYPGGSEERLRQLEYILDPARLAGGFVDNIGYGERGAGSTQAVRYDVVRGAPYDIIYGQK